MLYIAALTAWGFEKVCVDFFAMYNNGFGKRYMMRLLFQKRIQVYAPLQRLNKAEKA